MKALSVAAVVACSGPSIRPSAPEPSAEAPVAGAADVELPEAPEAGAPVDSPLVPVAPRGNVIVMTSDECGLIVDHIYFPAGSAMPAPDQRPTLDATALMFRCFRRTGEILSWEVQGHADPGEPDPVTLSASRAQVIRGELVQRGVLADSLRPRGYGMTQPIDRRRTPEARAKNQRVDFIPLERAP